MNNRAARRTGTHPLDTRTGQTNVKFFWKMPGVEVRRVVESGCGAGFKERQPGSLSQMMRFKVEPVAVPAAAG